MILLSNVAFWIIIGVGSFLLSGLIFSIVFTFATARQVYFHTLTKMTPDYWKRECSAPDNPEQMKMWEEGLNWRKENIQYVEEVSIVNDGLHLVGEFYYYGYKRTVIFLSGRSECLWYSCYYAKPYPEMGYNILTIDPRGHGLSEGKYSTAGIKESQDVLAWIDFLNKEKKQQQVMLHCICVGGAAGLLAVKNDKNNLVERIVLDGAFINFKESYKKHYIASGHALFPVYYQIWPWFKHYTGVNPLDSNPLEIVKNLKIPILFLYSKLDTFSIPENSQIMINVCKSEQKNYVWFDKGSHSHLRNNNEEKYDEAIKAFIK